MSEQFLSPSPCSQETAYMPIFSESNSPRILKSSRSPVTFTEAAIERLIFLEKQKTPESSGLRLELRQKGCSGVSYDLVYIDEKNSKDIIIEQGGATLFLDPRTLLFITGMIIDYEITPLGEGFQFTNPQAKGRCGCGDSDYI